MAGVMMQQVAAFLRAISPQVRGLMAPLHAQLNPPQRE
jgi:hypothetical protein